MRRLAKQRVDVVLCALHLSLRARQVSSKTFITDAVATHITTNICTPSTTASEPTAASTSATWTCASCTSATCTGSPSAGRLLLMLAHPVVHPPVGEHDVRVQDLACPGIERVRSDGIHTLCRDSPRDRRVAKIARRVVRREVRICGQHRADRIDETSTLECGVPVLHAPLDGGPPPLRHRRVDVVRNRLDRYRERRVRIGLLKPPPLDHVDLAVSAPGRQRLSTSRRPKLSVCEIPKPHAVVRRACDEAAVQFGQLGKRDLELERDRRVDALRVVRDRHVRLDLEVEITHESTHGAQACTAAAEHPLRRVKEPRGAVTHVAALRDGGARLAGHAQPRRHFALKPQRLRRAKWAMRLARVHGRLTTARCLDISTVVCINMAIVVRARIRRVARSTVGTYPRGDVRRLERAHPPGPRAVGVQAAVDRAARPRAQQQLRPDQVEVDAVGRQLEPVRAALGLAQRLVEHIRSAIRPARKDADDKLGRTN
eukprot:5731756-Pleurochrysis_carterae.AAC.2